MRTSFQKELKELHTQFYKMGLNVHEAVHHSLEAYTTHDLLKATQVIEGDKHINTMEANLEHTSIELIALQQPVSSDLRKIIAIMKASVDLERIGDHAVSMSKACLTLKHEKPNNQIDKKILVIGEKVNRMLLDVMDAFIHTDEKKAILTAHRNVEISVLTQQAHTHILNEKTGDRGEMLSASTHIIVLGYLKRIGDYVTNLSEWIAYEATGETIDLNHLPK